MKLTQANYYTHANRYLSSSKIKDWMLDKDYFYRKHVVGTLKEERKTRALLVGDMVDVLLTQPRSFTKRFEVVSRRRKSDDDILQVTVSEYEEAARLADAIKKTSAYKKIRKERFRAQVILQKDMPIGTYFDGICGMLDWLKVYPDKKRAVIVDLKTAQRAEEGKYRFQCEQFGYFRQMAMYRELVRQVYGKDLTVTCYHLVVEKDPDGIHHVYLYQFDGSRLDTEWRKIQQAMSDIAKEKDFDKKDATFGYAPVLQ